MRFRDKLLGSGIPRWWSTESAAVPLLKGDRDTKMTTKKVSKSKLSKQSKIVLIVAGAVWLFMLSCVGLSILLDPVTPETKATSNSVEKEKVWFLVIDSGEDIPVTNSRFDYERAVRYAAENNTTGVANMIADNKIWNVPSGSSVTVVRRETLCSLVKLENGPYADTLCWVRTELISEE